MYYYVFQMGSMQQPGYLFSCEKTALKLIIQFKNTTNTTKYTRLHWGNSKAKINCNDYYIYM